MSLILPPGSDTVSAHHTPHFKTPHTPPHIHTNTLHALHATHTAYTPHTHYITTTPQLHSLIHPHCTLHTEQYSTRNHIFADLPIFRQFANLSQSANLYSAKNTARYLQSALAQSCFLLHKSQYFTSLNILQPQYFADFKYSLNPASLLEIVFHQPSQ